MQSTKINIMDTFNNKIIVAHKTVYISTVYTWMSVCKLKNSVFDAIPPGASFQA